jgi:hypothetical protein
LNAQQVKELSKMNDQLSTEPCCFLMDYGAERHVEVTPLAVEDVQDEDRHHVLLLQFLDWNTLLDSYQYSPHTENITVLAFMPSKHAHSWTVGPELITALQSKSSPIIAEYCPFPRTSIDNVSSFLSQQLGHVHWRLSSQWMAELWAADKPLELFLASFNMIFEITWSTVMTRKTLIRIDFKGNFESRSSL